MSVFLGPFLTGLAVCLTTTSVEAFAEEKVVEGNPLGGLAVDLMRQGEMFTLFNDMGGVEFEPGPEVPILRLKTILWPSKNFRADALRVISRLSKQLSASHPRSSVILFYTGSAGRAFAEEIRTELQAGLNMRCVQPECAGIGKRVHAVGIPAGRLPDGALEVGIGFADSGNISE